jgi:hypothetical protein
MDAPWYARLADAILSREGLIGLLLAFMIISDSMQRRLTEQNTNQLIRSIELHLSESSKERKQLIATLERILERR